MTTKSVSINRIERNSIATKIKKQYAKLASIKHPDPDFHKNISKAAYKKAVDNLAEKVKTAPEILPHLNYYPISSFSNDIDNVFFDNATIKVVNTARTQLLNDTARLAAFEPNEVIMPDVFNNNHNAVSMPFCTWGHSIYNSDKITLDEETLKQIEVYNDEMTEVYTELSNQLNTLLAIVHKCKSTKMFETKLPNLVSLYPETVQRKLRKKNNTANEEVTLEQQQLLDATASLAAAALLEDK